MFVSDKIKVLKNTKGRGIFAKEDIGKSELIIEFKKTYISYPTNTCLRIDENLYQDNLDREATENFVNHSCEPNAFIQFDDMSLISLRKIKKGEEITYNYLTVDWDKEDVFKCKCKSKKCLKELRGFKHLPIEEKKKLEPMLSPFLKKKLNEEIKVM